MSARPNAGTSQNRDLQQSGGDKEDKCYPCLSAAQAGGLRVQGHAWGAQFQVSPSRQAQLACWGSATPPVGNATQHLAEKHPLKVQLRQ